MPTLSQGGAPNIVSANLYSEDRIVVLTAQIYDSSALTANTFAARSYTIVAVGTTPTTGQISVGGLLPTDTILAVQPAVTGSTIAATASPITGYVASATTVVVGWINTAGTAPTTAAGPVQVVVYRAPSYPVTKTTFEG